VEQLDFEFVLFASTVVDYDYIMTLIANYTTQEPSKQTMTKDQLIRRFKSNANMADEQEDIEAYINTLEIGSPLDVEEQALFALCLAFLSRLGLCVGLAGFLSVALV
jgi:type I restriction enzyme R subunit